MADNECLGQLQSHVCLSDLVLLKTIGIGTFGRVQLCRLQNDDSGRVFAIKIMKKSVILKFKQVAHVKNEKSVSVMVKTPGIAQLCEIDRFASFQTEKSVCFLSEFVVGGELFRRMREVGMMGNEATVFYAAEVANTLGYLHSLSIAYRDLKPENLLIDATGHLKFVDFGFAKVIEDKTFTLCGTPEYLSPEAIERRGHGKSVDWWALGILIYEMLVGVPPFSDQNPYRLYEKIIQGSYEMPDFLSDKAVSIIQELLNPDPDERLGATVSFI